MRTTARRDLRKLRDAMAAEGLNLQALSARTRACDPHGRGVSWQTIACLATERVVWARETTKPRTAALIEDALSVPRGTLFTLEDVPESRGRKAMTP